VSLRLVRAVAETENLDSLHISRLLVLLRSLAARGRSRKPVEGITKLAKLDFLLRYPQCLERALAVRGADPMLASVLPRERTSIESSMIRFRYGPWDHRYRRWLGLLASRGLVSLAVHGRTVHVLLTERGHTIADELRSQESFHVIASRSDVLAKTLGSLSATALKNFVYDIVPEILDMKWGESIGRQLQRSNLIPRRGRT